jgi:hypothetical protein
MNLREIDWEGVGWMHLAHDRNPLVGYCERPAELLLASQEGFYSTDLVISLVSEKELFTFICSASSNI